MTQRDHREVRDAKLEAYIEAVERVRHAHQESASNAPLTSELVRSIGRGLSMTEDELQRIDQEAERNYELGRRFAAKGAWDDAIECLIDAGALAPWRDDIQYELAQALFAAAKNLKEPLPSRIFLLHEALEALAPLAAAEQPSVDHLFLQRELESFLRPLEERQLLLNAEAASQALAARRKLLLTIAGVISAALLIYFKPMLVLGVIFVVLMIGFVLSHFA